MSEDNNNQQASKNDMPKNDMPVGSFDPNAASYVPNSDAYNQAQQEMNGSVPAGRQSYAQGQAAQNQGQAYAQGQTQGQQHNPAQPVQGQAQAQPQGQPAQPYGQSGQPTQAYGQPAQPYAQQPMNGGAPAGQQPPYGYQQGTPTGAPTGMPYQQPYMQNPYQPAGVPVKNHNTSTLVLGILSILCGFMSPLFAWILGGIALHFAKKDRKIFGPDACKAGRTCAIIGIVIGIVMWVISMALILSGYADVDVDVLGTSVSSSSTF